MASYKITLISWRLNADDAFIQISTTATSEYILDSVSVDTTHAIGTGYSVSYSSGATHPVIYGHDISTHSVNSEVAVIKFNKRSSQDAPHTIQVVITLVDPITTTTITETRNVLVPGMVGSLAESAGENYNISDLHTSTSTPDCANYGSFPLLSSSLKKFRGGIKYDDGNGGTNKFQVWFKDNVGLASVFPKRYMNHSGLRNTMFSETHDFAFATSLDKDTEWIALSVAQLYSFGNDWWWTGSVGSTTSSNASTTRTYSQVKTFLNNPTTINGLAPDPFVTFGRTIRVSSPITCPAPPAYTYDVCVDTDTVDCQGNTIPVQHRAPAGAEYIAGNVAFNVSTCCTVSCANFAVSSNVTPTNVWSNSGTITVTPTGGLAPYSYTLVPAAPLQINPSATQDDSTCDTTIGNSIINCDSNNVIAPGMNITISGVGIPANSWVSWVDTPGAVTQFSIATGTMALPTAALPTASVSNVTATFTPGAFHVFGGMGATTHTVLIYDANTPACGTSNSVTVGTKLYPQGCTDNTAQNYDPNAAADCNGDILPDPAYVQAVGWDSCCIAQVSGCTDVNAINYNPAAIIDDGSCIYPLSGCIPTSINSLISKTGDCLDYKGDKALIQIQTGLIDDCSTKTAWTLILIHYLLSKIGLPCVYNCQDYETLDPATNNVYTEDYLENFINFVNKNCDSCFGTNDNNAGPAPGSGVGIFISDGTTVGGNTITINGITYNI